VPRVLVAVGLALALGACGTVPRFTAGSQTIRVRLGRSFQVVLAANPTTGYFWQLAAPLPAVVSLSGSQYVAGPNARQLAGAGGQEVWTFRAAARGQGEIELQYARSAGPAAQSLAFAVRVG